MIKNNLILLFSILTMMSCEKESSNNVCDEHNTEQSKFTLIAGDVINDSVNHFEFQPFIMVRGYRYGVDTNYMYNDSTDIDVNNDGRSDLYYKYYMSYLESCCDDPGSLDCCWPNVTIKCLVKTELNIEIAIEDTLRSKLPKSFSVGDTIDYKNDWQSYEDYQPFSFAGMREFWDTDNYNNYMGFRIIEDLDTLYGWIRINTHFSNSIDIYDYVLEKK